MRVYSARMFMQWRPWVNVRICHTWRLAESSRPELGSGRFIASISEPQLGRGYGSGHADNTRPGRRVVTLWLPIFASSVGGAAVTLLGVAAGGLIANRSQTRHWVRDKQI